MTVQTVAPPRRIYPSTIAWSVLAAVLLVVSIAMAVFWPDRAIVIDLVDTTPTTIIPAQSVGLIPPACASADLVAYPCPDMVVVAR